MLTAIQDQAVVARMTGLRWVAVAAEVGVSERTLRRWCQDPEFSAELDAARAVCRDAALDLLSARSRDLAQVLVDVATDPTASPAARVSAAREGLSRLGVAETHRHELQAHVNEEGLREALRAAVRNMTDEELGV